MLKFQAFKSIFLVPIPAHSHEQIPVLFHKCSKDHKTIAAPPKDAQPKKEAAPKEAKPKAAAQPTPPTPPQEEVVPKPAAKPKDPLAELPPSKMIMDSWKRLYSNTPASKFNEICINGLWNGADIPNSPNNEVISLLRRYCLVHSLLQSFLAESEQSL